MTLTTITQAEPWMTPDERDINEDLIGAITRYLTEASVPENALVDLRINDITSTWLLARRLETALAPAEDQPAPCPTPAQADAIGKCRERLRKAIKELEEYTAKHGKPEPQGLVERMHDAVMQIRASGLSTDIFSTIPVEQDLETEDPTPETPENPYRALNNAPETPEKTNRPLNNAPETPEDPNRPLNNAPGTPENPNRPLNNAPETPEKTNPVKDYTTEPAVDPNLLNHHAPYDPYHPQTPAGPNPERNTPAANPPSSPPEDRRKTGERYRERYLTTQKSLHEGRTRRDQYFAIDIPCGPPRRKPPQNTG